MKPNLPIIHSLALVFALILSTSAFACENEVNTPNGLACIDNPLAWIHDHCPDARGQIHGTNEKITADCGHADSRKSSEGSL